MSITFVKNNINLIIIATVFIASIIAATATTQIFYTKKAEAGMTVCVSSRGNYYPNSYGYCAPYDQKRYIKTYDCWRAWSWAGYRTVCGWR